MYLAADEHEAAIAASAADFLRDAIPIERLHKPDASDLTAEVRRRLGDMGWFGLALPEDLGGSGLSAVEHALFHCEVGRNCGPVDVLAQGLGAMAAGDDRSLIARILSGETAVALAVRQNAKLRILGHPQAALALEADAAGARLFDITNVAAAERPALDPSTTMRLAVDTDAHLLSETEGETIWQFGQVGVAAMLVGLAEAAAAQIVAYAKVRETFGRKIGSYQAVRHPCVDMALRAEAARAQLWYGAAALKENRPDARAHIDAAKHLANIAAVSNGDTNIQLHGGIGITDDHDAHLILKHALVLTRLFGSKRQLLSGLLHARLED